MTSVVDATEHDVEPGRDEWTAICAVDDLIVDRGVCALVDGDHVAVFRVSGSGEMFAIGNVDPFCDASVLSRGLVGSVERDGDSARYVASPLRKHRFDLRTGLSLDDPAIGVGVWDVRIRGGLVTVGAVLVEAANRQSEDMGGKRDGNTGR
jgi:NAD(P)H-dependent nitrite reductase small subunit